MSEMYLEGVSIDYIESLEGAGSSSTIRMSRHLRLRQFVQREERGPATFSACFLKWAFAI